MSFNQADLAMPSLSRKVEMDVVNYKGEEFFKIAHFDQMRPFFMSIVSDANHWMFISSNGGLSAGRKGPEYALFPYYTEDKIVDFADTTGSKTILQIQHHGETLLWEPFSDRFRENYDLSRNLYKSVYGNKIMFEEINHDLGLTFRYQWASSNRYGFVRKAELINNSLSDYKIGVLDGIQNLMPYGVPSDLQRSTSNLVDAYKRNELDQKTGLGIYSLSAIIVDRAEPSEALKANVAWSAGLENPIFLLSSTQLSKFRKGAQPEPEWDIKGEKGAYFGYQSLNLGANAQKSWVIVADVNQGRSRVAALRHALEKPDLLQNALWKDVEEGTRKLIALVAASDGLQHSADRLNDTRHYSNVLFNIMRGGIFDENYRIDKQDLLNHLRKSNSGVYDKQYASLQALPDPLHVKGLLTTLAKIADQDLFRLCTEYLPLKFSRRHGDPSRPWNNFSINTQNEKDGSKVLDYEGNWRDLFQNWEALAISYPGFIKGMMFKFLNASTFDGYNPYRVTKDGFDWETIEPDNPWSYIGYWGDHQIIYLQKFFEIAERIHPGLLESWFDQDHFVYAAVPYRIKAYEQLLHNPKDTIEFDEEWDALIRSRREEMGADGALLQSDEGSIYHVNLLEKLLATLLAKMSNFIPEAGIWMNTQRPEWNDANNALVGNGASMVTLYYMYRFLSFFQTILNQSDKDQIKVSSELIEFYHSVRQTLSDYSPLLSEPFSDTDRKRIVDQLGVAASDYRTHIYRNGFWGKKRSISINGIKTFVQLSLDFIEHSILANQRPDKLYHAYNLVALKEDRIEVEYLSEMLEGQVAVLSSGYLQAEEALEVLDALKASALFRPDQYSYLLYPNKSLPGFLEKNNIPELQVERSALFKQMIDDGDVRLVEKDVYGRYHFNGDFKNASDLEDALDALKDSDYSELVKKERGVVLSIFEQVFHHKAFTGRSGTFFSYEGLGSIYWHMVSKLHLAVQEVSLAAIHAGANPKTVGRLLDHYYEIDAGIGVHKSPSLYGAFPTDPYSHTPMHRGAQQPGMTGQVKEDILVRFGELGVFVEDGQIVFHPCLLRKDEFLADGGQFYYVDVQGKEQKIAYPSHSLCFTYNQVPVIYTLGLSSSVEIHFQDGGVKTLQGLAVDEACSAMVHHRRAEVKEIRVQIDQKILK